MFIIPGYGLDVQNQGQCQEPRVFFFANHSALGWTYYKVNMVLNCMLGSLMVLGVWFFAMFRGILARIGESFVLTKSRFQHRLLYRQHRFRTIRFGGLLLGGRTSATDAKR
jgi:hypothetical protein